ncbi:cuticle protein 18.7 [Cephus cinctus]|uniref:Cuticle protein 18.7 n=1 Tax=Cephus cinctus TaxID=211228 RepID=A0AAJ7FHE6_CEPCN|nr:cuticle protein 18.7 [Cephus cinctus]
MKFLIVLSSLVAVSLARPSYGHGYGLVPVAHGYHGPAAPLAHDGRVVDTPEVAHAKAAHFAAHAEAAAHAHYSPAYGHGEGIFVAAPAHGYAAPHGYHGPAAPLAHDGRVIDTPEVAHAKAAHFAAHAEAATHAHYAPEYSHGGVLVGGPGYGYAAPHGYHGPAAPLAHDGRVVDTPEVAHAKAAHLSVLAEESAKAAHYGGHGLHHW